ncbi:hypothetical protein PIB30_103126, partial [Stylosanthes scabra]|nr:hypothetical protein [Stylosanthes scabra]
LCSSLAISNNHDILKVGSLQSTSSSSPPVLLFSFLRPTYSIALLVAATDSLMAAVESHIAVAIEFIAAINVVVSRGGSESKGTLLVLRLCAAI